MSAKPTPSPKPNGSTAPKSSPNGVPKSSSQAEHELDIPKLHSLPSEQQDLYLFTFITHLEAHLDTLDSSLIIARQSDVKKQLLQIIRLQTPGPTRVIRNSLGRCFARVLGKGDRKILFETVGELLDVLNVGASKSEKDVRHKHAAIYCLGEAYKAAGDSAINFASSACSGLIRLVKIAQNHAAARAAIFKALGKVVASVRTSLDEGTARDVWKVARNTASGEKSHVVQRWACWCLEQLVRETAFFNNANDFESLKNTLWKVAESASPVVRHAAASCLAAAYIKAFSSAAGVESAVPRIKKPKKGSQAQSLSESHESEGSGLGRSGSSAGRKKSTIRLELSLIEILEQMSAQYTRSTTTNRGRAAVISCYASVLMGLESQIVARGYQTIADHFLTDLLNHPVITFNRYRTLLTRKFVQKILGDVVGQQILGESGQVDAAKGLINNFLKNYPQVIKERPEPTKNALTAALSLLASLIESLGSAFSPLADICREGLLQTLQHPSYTVQIHTSYCLRELALACPQQLIQCASICLNSVTRELNLMTSDRHAARRCLGYANGLAAVISVSPSQPLYGSLEINSRVLSEATDLLKSSTNTELRISRIQVQVAWILIGGLMTLGPNFVKIHLSQLLLLWRNALPKPLTRENIGQRQPLEISYLVHVRESALGSLLSFLEFNSRLITVDVAKRIAFMLKNTTDFLESLPVEREKSNSDGILRANSSLQLPELVQMVRRRVLQCFAQLATRSPQSSIEILSQSNILSFAFSCFAEPDGYSSGSLGTSIANSASYFESIWNTADNYGFGVSGCMRGLYIRPLPGEKAQEGSARGSGQRDVDSAVDAAIRSPICSAREHDSINLYLAHSGELDQLPDPPATEVVNSAISVFAMALPLQDAKIQESMLEQLSTSMSSRALQRDPGRRAALNVNIALAVLGALKVSTNETKANSGDLRSPAVEKAMDDLLRNLAINQDKYIRNAASEALGRLCNGSGNVFTTNVVNTLVETIVSNREPNARAGCATALGAIHSNVGGMAAGLHLRKIHGVLMSLCSDPHPTVHYWAIQALSKVADSAGLNFSGYVPSTLGLLAQLWISDTHTEETDSTLNSNEESEQPSTVAIAGCIGSLINVLGPDLQDVSKTRELLLSLVRQFDLDDALAVKAEALECWEYVCLYAPTHVDLSRYVQQLQSALSPVSSTMHEVGADGIYSLMKRSNPQEILDLASGNFEEQIWTSVEVPHLRIAISNVIRVWVAQTSLTHTSQWVSRFQEVLTKTVGKATDEAARQAEAQKSLQSAAPEFQDEEVAGFAAANPKEDDEGGSAKAGQELLRWQTRLLALQYLNEVLVSGGKDLLSNPVSAAGAALQARVADIIRMAFLASTSSVVQLRIAGLNLIDQVLTIFGKTPDPDFAEALLLEQYQAQIGSALTPAFGADSSPELASAAINVCATFIATGLVTDVDRMGRILKLMVSALSSFTSGGGEPNIGELKGLSTNAQVMVKMAVLSGWAELQVASTEQSYLVEVVKPYVGKLTPLWLSSLQEFARLRFEPDISSSMGVHPGDSLDTIYAALNRQTLLKFYQDSWLKLVDAIASLIDQDSNLVFDALDGKAEKTSAEGRKMSATGISYRDEPVAFFFVLFGIAFEALITRPGTDSGGLEDQTLDILHALRRILRPSVAGHAIYQDVVFSETMELFDRLALTEGLEIQGVIIEIVKNLCLSHPSVGIEQPDEESISENVEQMFELTRIITLIIAGILPSLGDNPSNVRSQLSNEATTVIISSLRALVEVAEVFPAVIRTDLHACILHVFTRILGTGVCQASVVPNMLPIFKGFAQSLALSATSTTSMYLTACMQSFRRILAVAQRRENESSLPCARNTLLAMTILLTSGAQGIPADDSLVFQLLDDIIDCLQDVGLGSVAANCLHSLLLTEPKTAAGKVIAQYLLPRLLYYLANTNQPDPENVRHLLAQTVTGYVSNLGNSSTDYDSEPDAVSAALSMVIPALLQRADNEGSELYAETAGRLLVLAGVDQAAFRGVMVKMDGELRAFMEEVIREGGGMGRDDKKEEKGEPSIALKMEFGG